MADILGALRKGVTNFTRGVAQSSASWPQQFMAMERMRAQNEATRQKALDAKIELARLLGDLESFRGAVAEKYGADSPIALNAEAYFDYQKDLREKETMIKPGFLPGSNLAYDPLSRELLPQEEGIGQAQKKYGQGIAKITPDGFPITREGEVQLEGSVYEAAQKSRREKAQAALQDKITLEGVRAAIRGTETEAKQDAAQKMYWQKLAADTSKDIFTKVNQGTLDPKDAYQAALDRLEAGGHPLARERAARIKSRAYNAAIKPGLSPKQVDAMGEFEVIMHSADEIIGLLNDPTVTAGLGRYGGTLTGLERAITGEETIDPKLIRLSFLLANTKELILRDRTGATINDQELKVYGKMLGGETLAPRATQLRMKELIVVTNELIRTTYIKSLENKRGIGRVTPKILAQIPQYERTSWTEDETAPSAPWKIKKTPTTE